MTEPPQRAVPSHLVPVPVPPGLSADCGEEALVAYVRARYFTADELAQARQVEREGGYEAALAFLVKRGQETLRRSDEEHGPHLYITIPGAKIIIHRPGRPFDLGSGLTFSLAAFAGMAFPPGPTEGRGAEEAVFRQQQGMFALWGEVSPSQQKPHARSVLQPAPQKTTAHARKPHYDAQSIRVGAGKSWHTTTGWVARKRGLGYVIAQTRSGSGCEVSIIHLRSNWVLASFRIASPDELAHTRIRQLVEALLPLADWTQGIKAVLDMKQGTHKRFQWSAHILDIWQLQEQQTLFPQQALTQVDATPVQ